MFCPFTYSNRTFTLFFKNWIVCAVFGDPTHGRGHFLEKSKTSLAAGCQAGGKMSCVAAAPCHSLNDLTLQRHHGSPRSPTLLPCTQHSLCIHRSRERCYCGLWPDMKVHCLTVTQHCKQYCKITTITSMTKRNFKIPFLFYQHPKYGLLRCGQQQQMK